MTILTAPRLCFDGRVLRVPRNCRQGVGCYRCGHKLLGQSGLLYAVLDLIRFSMCCRCGYITGDKAVKKRT